MKHTWYQCPPGCENLYCHYCIGGLGLCTVCDGFEGQLPTECPGMSMTEEQKEAVYTGPLDFRNGQWCQKEKT